MGMDLLMCVIVVNLTHIKEILNENHLADPGMRIQACEL
jgi:hypothetical protein